MSEELFLSRVLPLILGGLGVLFTALGAGLLLGSGA
jgi:hypothetical protein